jgi:hypothetical protein
MHDNIVLEILSALDREVGEILEIDTVELFLGVEIENSEEWVGLCMYLEVSLNLICFTPVIMNSIF